MDADAATPTANVVNGINVDDLKALIADVERNASNGRTSWCVATSWQGQTRSRTEVAGFGLGGKEVARRFAFEIDEPCELGGTNAFANPQEHLLAALNACMTVGFVAQCAVRGITLDSLEIKTEGDIDLRGFLGLDPSVPPGYDSLRYTIRVKGDASEQQFAVVHAAVMATSPNFHNVSRPVKLTPTLIVEP
jgi:uncharacterized OsmC-like protein